MSGLSDGDLDRIEAVLVVGEALGDEGAREVVRVVAPLVAEVRRLQADLAECFRLTGADPDGNEEWRLAGKAVREVARLRDEEDRLDDEVLRLEAKSDRLLKMAQKLLAQRGRYRREALRLADAIRTHWDEATWSRSNARLWQALDEEGHDV